MSGPPPTPTGVLKNRGSWRAKSRPTEPSPVVGAPRLPAHLDGPAKVYWKRTVKFMLGSKTLSIGDEGVLATYCQACSDRDRFTLAIRKVGETFTTPQGYLAKNPLCTLLREARETILKCAARLGLSPADRTRVGQLPDSSDTDSPWAQFK